MRVKHLILPSLAVIALSSAPSAFAFRGGAGAATPRATGGVGLAAPSSLASSPSQRTVSTASTPSQPTVPGFVAKIIHGVAYAPSYAPIQVQRAIWAGNAIRHKPYIYGGGHGSFTDSGYDCSGAVSYALHGAGLLRTPMDSSGFMSWGQRGLGRWITVYTNPAHAFVQIAGIRLDTSAMDDPNPPPGTGPRWRPVVSGAPGFTTRHPAGL